MRLAEGRRLGGPLHVPLSAEATMRAVAGHPLQSVPQFPRTVRCG